MRKISATKREYGFVIDEIIGTIYNEIYDYKQELIGYEIKCLNGEVRNILTKEYSIKIY
jgi:hypothetical protein